MALLDLRLDNQYNIISSPLLIRFVTNHDIDKDLNTSLSFPDQATPSTLQHNVRIILWLKIRKIKEYWGSEKRRYSYKTGLYNSRSETCRL